MHRSSFIVVILSALFSSCSIPKAPGKLEWDVLLTAPFGVETYRLLDLVDPDSTIDEQGWGVRLGDDSVLVFTAHGDFDTGIEDSLRLDPFGYTINKFIDAIFLPIEVNHTYSPRLASLNPDIAAQHGQTLELDPYPISDQHLFAMPQGVDSFRVDTGHVVVRFHNTLADLSQLSILFDNQRGTELAVVSDASLALDSTLSVALDLNGIDFSTACRFQFLAIAAGGIVTVDSTRSVSWSVEWHTLQCEPYYGIVYPQVLLEDSTFDLDQRHRLYSGTVKSGTLELIARNTTQFDDSIFVTIHDVFNSNDESLEIIQFVSAGNVDTATIDLTGYRIRLYHEFPQRLRAALRSVSIQTSDHRGFINHFEIVSGEFSVSELVLSYFDGELSNLQATIPYDEITVERPPEGWDAIHPTTVDIALHVESSTAVYADVNLYLASFLGANLVDTVNLSLREVYFGSDSVIWIRDVARLVREYPDRFTFEGNAVVNGVIATSDTGRIRANVELVAPLRFRMDTVNAPGEVQRVDTEPIEDIITANARVKIWNRLPVGGDAIVLISSDSSALAPGSGQIVDTAAVVSIPLPPIENGRAAETIFTELVVPVEAHVIELLRHPPYFARVSILLPGAGDQEFIAHASDYVQAQVVGEITYRINSEDGP